MTRPFHHMRKDAPDAVAAIELAQPAIQVNTLHASDEAGAIRA